MNSCQCTYAGIAAAAASATFGGNILGLGRALAGATALTTAFGAEKFIEAFTDQVINDLETNNDFSFAGDYEASLYETASLCIPVAANSLVLYASMYAVTTVLSLASISVATFSLPGALGVSLITAVATSAIDSIQNIKCGPSIEETFQEDENSLFSFSLENKNPLSTVPTNLTDAPCDSIFSNGRIVQHEGQNFFIEMTSGEETGRVFLV